MSRYTHPHPFQDRKPAPIADVLRDLADRVDATTRPECDALIYGAKVIEELEQKLDASLHNNDKLADALIDTQKDVRDLRDAVDLLIFKSRRPRE